VNARELGDILTSNYRRRRQLGYGLSGRVCLDCNEPLFTEELLHEPPPGYPLDPADSIRWSTSRYNKTWLARASE
jgi:hypothetical protein